MSLNVIVGHTLGMGHLKRERTGPRIFFTALLYWCANLSYFAVYPLVNTVMTCLRFAATRKILCRSP